VVVPEASVIIPAFNCETYVEDCLSSVTGRSEGNIEIIVIDDGSTDRTLGSDEIGNRLRAWDLTHSRFREGSFNVICSFDFPGQYQVFTYEHRAWPTEERPLARPLAGEKFENIVPVCHKSS
jgi:hypothetical protein